MLAFLSLLVWRLRIKDGRRWATAGAIIPWAVVSSTSAGAFHWFTTTDTWNYQVPEYFWSCVFLSMAIGIILGSCAGGMIHHQTLHLRNH
jgi:predicted MFS family arabinose efflux permease